MSVRYFDDRILLTDTHAWAYYRLPTHAYEFTTAPEREAMAVNITVALAAIRVPDAEVHLRIGHHSYPAAAWAARLDATSDGGPGWHDYLDEMYQHVWSKDFWTKEVYLGVRLGPRRMRGQLSGGALSFMGAYRASEQVLGLADEAVGDSELARWTGQSERLGRALQASALSARHATRDELAWLFGHTLAAAVGVPPPHLGGGRDRIAAGGPGAQRPDHAHAGAPGRGVLHSVPVVLPVPRRHVLPGLRTLAAFR